MHPVWTFGWSNSFARHWVFLCGWAIQEPSEMVKQMRRKILHTLLIPVIFLLYFMACLALEWIYPKMMDDERWMAD